MSSFIYLKHILKYVHKIHNFEGGGSLYLALVVPMCSPQSRHNKWKETQYLMYIINGYFSANESTRHEWTSCPAENRLGAAEMDARCSRAFPNMCITAVCGHQRMTSVIQEQYKMMRVATFNGLLFTVWFLKGVSVSHTAAGLQPCADCFTLPLPAFVLHLFLLPSDNH